MYFKNSKNRRNGSHKISENIINMSVWFAILPFMVLLYEFIIVVTLKKFVNNLC